MQPAKDRIDTDGIRFSAAMARIWTWVFKIGERRIGNTGTQRHVWAPGVVRLSPLAAHENLKDRGRGIRHTLERTACPRV